MGPKLERLMMYDSPAENGGLTWQWVEDQLVNAGAYWVVAPGTGHPHPRPVWGIWDNNELFLSIGSPKIKAAAQLDGPVTIHLGSIEDVVIVEGSTAGSAEASHLVTAYNKKYDWDYIVEEYGPFTRVEPAKAIAWRSAGWAGREGFQATGRWTFPSESE